MSVLSSAGDFGGFRDEAMSRRINELFQQLFGYVYWCCSGHTWDWPHVHHLYPLPQKLGEARGHDGPWQIPVIEMPPQWCGEVPGANWPFFEYLNHPCHGFNASQA